MRDLQKILKALKESGYASGRDLDEIAVCLPARKEPVVTFRGAWGDKEILPTIQTALGSLGAESQLDPTSSGSHGRRRGRSSVRSSRAAATSCKA
jgi:hypothetical protein